MRTGNLCFSSPCRRFWCRFKFEHRGYREIMGVWTGKYFPWWHHFCPSVLHGCFGLTLTLCGRYLICIPPELCALWRCDALPNTVGWRESGKGGKERRLTQNRPLCFNERGLLCQETGWNAQAVAAVVTITIVFSFLEADSCQFSAAGREI